MNLYRLGQTLTNYRKAKGMTIRQFAEESGISTSLISQIERGQANPTLSVLELLAKAFNVPLYTLFEGEIEYDNLISRKELRQKIYRQDSNHVVYDVLTPDFMKTHIKTLMMELNPHASTTAKEYIHSDQEEVAVVTKGEVTALLDGQAFTLDEGDVIRIPPNVKHHFENRSDNTVHVLFVLTPAIA